MKTLALLALSPLFLANQFAASEFEFTAHFVALIQQHKLTAAKRMLAPNAVIRSWDDYGRTKSFESFATYMTSCPVHDIEGVDTNDAHNINVNLKCKVLGGASLEMSKGKITTINYGGAPPPLVRIIQEPSSDK